MMISESYSSSSRCLVGHRVQSSVTSRPASQRSDSPEDVKMKGAEEAKPHTLTECHGRLTSNRDRSIAQDELLSVHRQKQRTTGRGVSSALC